MKKYYVFKNSAVNILGWGLPAAANLFAIPVIIKKLGYDVYGLWILTMAVMGYFALLDFGFARGGIRFLSEFHARKKEDNANQAISLGFIFYLLMGLIGCALILVCTNIFIIDLINLPDELRDIAGNVLHLAAFGFIVTLMQSYMLALPQALHRFEVSSFADAFYQLLGIGLILLALFLGKGIMTMLVIRILMNLLCCLTIIIFTKSHLNYFKFTFRIERNLAKKMLSYSLFSFIGRLGAATTNHFQTFVLGAVMNTTAIAIFSVPFQLVSRLRSMFAKIAIVIFPISSELREEHDRTSLLAIYMQMTRGIFLLNMFFLVTVCLFSKSILIFWIGPDFAEKAYRILVYITIGMFFEITTNMPSQVNDGIYTPKITSTFSLSRGVVGIVAAVVGGKSGGVQGVAIGYMVSSIIMSLVFNIYVHAKIIKISYYELIKKTYLDIIVFSVLIWFLLQYMNQLLPPNTCLFFLTNFFTLFVLYAFFACAKVIPKLKHQALKFGDV